MVRITLLLLIVGLAGCQTYPKNPPECAGPYESLNDEYIYQGDASE